MEGKSSQRRDSPLRISVSSTLEVGPLDGSRYVVITETGAGVSLVSVRMLSPDVKCLLCSEGDRRITGVAQQENAIL